MTGARSVPLVVLDEDGAHRVDDRVAEEEPLGITVNGQSVAVVMRTPGHDLELVLGFLVTEQVIARASDVAHLAHCEVAPDPEADENVVQVRLAPGVHLDAERLRRNLFASSSCGLCGKATVENALALAGKIDDDVSVSSSVVRALPEQLREHQQVFEATGGLHAAGLFDEHGTLLVVREDVGRHNAVDKVVGWAIEAGRLPLARHLLCVSGRISFEVVQKAAAARIPIVVAVSAPTSLAVRTADALGITLIGFVRGARANVYSHPARVREAAST